jgi:serine/threonine protein kinase
MDEEEEDDKINEFKMLFKLDIGKSLGRGKYGLVKEIHHKNQVYAGKLVKKEGIVDECELILQFKSPYIVKIVKIFNLIHII